MKTYTTEQKREYFKGLRERWQTIKSAVDDKQLDAIKAIIAEHGLNVSPWSYAFTVSSMKYHGFDGIPYLDCKTFMGWKERGFIVRKGEKSLISGITWVSVEGKEGEANDNGFKFPKEYHLFNRTQVEELKA